MTFEEFRDHYLAAGVPVYPWQEEMLRRMVSGERVRLYVAPPRSTGRGWLERMARQLWAERALAAARRHHSDRPPRCRYHPGVRDSQ